MLVTLNDFSISTGLNFFAKQAVNAADKLTECTFHILDGATTSLGRLLPNLRPTSIGDVILQAKKTGSALLTTPKGNYLIEITKDKAGRYTFHAVGESLKPVIFHEGKKRMSGAVWEVKVSEYLQKIVKNAESVSYGDVATRWRGDKFVALKEQFCADGLLRKRGDEVLLKLPEEPPMTFKGPQASLQAEMVLKRFFQDRKTPIEEQQSERWDTLNRLFLGYLYFSGYALAPWVNDNVMLPHQRAQREEKQAQRIAADSFLDDSELREMVQNPNLRQSVIDMAEAQADGGDTRLLSQLEEITFQKDGYSQTYEYDGKSYEDSLVFSSNKEVHSRKVCPKAGFCEEFITEKSDENLIYTQKQHRADKIDVQKATFQKDGDEWTLVKEEKYEENRVLRLSDRSFASTILAQSQQITVNTATVCLATVLSGQTPQMAVIASLFSLVSHARAIAVSPPVAEARQVKEIKSGSADALMRRTAPITLLNAFPLLFAEVGSQLNYTINLQSDYQLSNPNLNLELSIQPANGIPLPSWISMGMGPISQTNSKYLLTSNSNFAVSNGYLYITSVTTSPNYTLNIIDTTNLSTVGQWVPSSFGNVYIQGNYAFLVGPIGYPSPDCQIQVIDISSPLTPALVSKLSLANSTNNIIYVYLLKNYIYIINTTFTGQAVQNLITIDISDPKQLIQTSSIPFPYNFYGIYAENNYLFLYTGGIAEIMSISDPSNPSLLTTMSFPGLCTSMAVRDNYLFIGTHDLLIYDISNITNPILVKTVSLESRDYNYYLSGQFNYLTINGNYIYGSCSRYGTVVFDITDVPNTHIIESFNGGQNNYPYQGYLNRNNLIFTDGGTSHTLQLWNAGLRVLSGTPGPSDRGLLLLNITAQDDVGNSLIDQIAIHVGNITVAMPIPNQTVFVGNSTMFAVDPGTFNFPNATFTYSATLFEGLSLPACINFDAESCTFLFTPRSGDQNTYRIQVTAEDGYGGVASTNFNLVIPDRPPVLAQPLADQIAYSMVPFEYIFTNTSFTDPDQDKLSYSALSVGGGALPTWLSFNGALREFSGTPIGRNVYDIQVVANDGLDQTIAGSFTLTVPSSAPAVLNPIGTQLASVGNVFIFAVSSNTFISLDGDPMTYFAGPLPSFLSFNNATKTFTGTPQNQDAGTYSITVYAENPFEQSTPTTFALTVLSATNNLPPVVVFQIPDFSVTSGVPFNHTFSSETFEDPEHQTLTYTTMLEGGAPLPNDLYFDGDSLTLSGVVPAPQTLRITMKATDPYGAFALDTFTVTVVDGTNYPPIVLNPLPDELATVGSPFFMQIPANTFKDPGGDPLTITVIQSGGMPLPKWLKWDPKKQIFSGTPGPFDTNTYAIREHTIDVWASDSTGSVKTSFKLSVNGESFWATFIKYGFSFVSVTGTGIALWKGRALIWNYLCKEKYHKPTEKAIVNQPFSRELQLKRKQVKEIRVFLDDKLLTLQKPFPDGLIYDDDKLSGIPTGKDIGRFTVRVVDYDGYINEEFDLIIKNKENPDPKKQPPSCAEVTRRRLAALCADMSSKIKGDEEKGRFGKMKDHLLSSQEMKSLHEGKEEEDQN